MEKYSWIPRVLAMIIVFFVICLYIYIHVYPYKEIVVAVYEEDLDWLDTIPKESYMKLTIYNKGSPKPELSGKYNVIQVPNYGRDGYVYLYHVVKNYDSLADVTLFVQGSTKSSKRKNDQYDKIKNTSTSLIVDQKINLDEIKNFSVNAHKNENPKNNAKNPEQRLDPAEDRPLGRWFDKRFPGEEIRCVSYAGILAASKEDIRKRPVSFYESLLRELSLTNPEVAHYTERVWANIFSISMEHCI